MIAAPSAAVMCRPFTMRPPSSHGACEAISVGRRSDDILPFTFPPFSSFVARRPRPPAFVGVSALICRFSHFLGSRLALLSGWMYFVHFVLRCARLSSRHSSLLRSGCIFEGCLQGCRRWLLLLRCMWMMRK